MAIRVGYISKYIYENILFNILDNIWLIFKKMIIIQHMEQIFKIIFSFISF